MLFEGIKKASFSRLFRGDGVKMDVEQDSDIVEFKKIMYIYE